MIMSRLRCTFWLSQPNRFQYCYYCLFVPGKIVWKFSLKTRTFCWRISSKCYPFPWSIGIYIVIKWNKIEIQLRPLLCSTHHHHSVKRTYVLVTERIELIDNGDHRILKWNVHPSMPCNINSSEAHTTVQNKFKSPFNRSCEIRRKFVIPNGVDVAIGIRSGNVRF